MLCMSCKEEIPSKFAHSIKTNVCPFCGLEIMEENLQKVLSSMQAAMKDAEPYMTEVEEWLGSNYSLYKVDKINDKIFEQSLGSEVEGDLLDEDFANDSNEDRYQRVMRIQAANRKKEEVAKATANFQKLAGVKDMKSIVKKIQMGTGAADPSEFVGIDPDYGAVDFGSEAGSPLSQQDAMSMIQALNNGVNESEDPVKNYYEIQKLKKLQSSSSNGPGKFYRSE